MSDTPAFDSMDSFRRWAAAMPLGDDAAGARASAREVTLTKPEGALGRLESLTRWLSIWQGRHPPSAEQIDVVVFAGNHGVAARGVSAFPPSVTAQMVANFESGGAAINQLTALLGASLRVIPVHLRTPTGDLTVEPAMSEPACLDALAVGAAAVSPETGLLCLGEMGIGNTTAAAALAAGLFGGDGATWAGPGTGVDADGLARKRAAVDAAIAHHRDQLTDPLAALARLGGLELAAIAGAVVAARHRRVPVMLDGFVCTAAAAVVDRLVPGGLDHCLAAHCSAEPGHRRLLQALALEPLLDLDMRLGEASGAALGALLVRAALATHTGMASFAEAGVSERVE